MDLKDTTVRDFGGGWNVADSDVNLESRYQPISDNVRRGLDGSLSVRSGYSLFSDLRLGTTAALTSASYSVSSFATKNWIHITIPSHGRVSGDHLTITAFSGGDFDTIPNSDLLGTNGIVVIDANTIRVPTRFAANAALTQNRTIAGTFDNHKLAGNIIHMHYFNRYLICWDHIGEIAMVDVNGVATPIWNATIANALAADLQPTHESDNVSSTSFKSTVISCNGYDKDKPLQIFIDPTLGLKVTYLTDKAAPFGQNLIPTADYVIGMHKYLIFVRIGVAYTYNSQPNATGDSYLSMSAENTDGLFYGTTTPGAKDDSAILDLALVTDTVEPVLLGCGVLRDKLYIGFYDKGMLGTLGIHSEDDPPLHIPDFEDTIAEHGLIAHRTVVSLGNDIFMCDYAGVPSVSISAQSGVFVPSRLSDLISPELTRHLSSMKEDTLRKKAFAVYNKTEREYMLFIPKYDETVRTLPRDPFYFNNGLRAKNLTYVYHPNHNLIEDSRILIAGATTIGSLTPAMINGVREVIAIVDENAYIVELSDPLIQNNITSGGGTACTITPINDESIGYIYEYNKELKIRRWTRYRQLWFDCGAVSNRGQIYFAKGGKVYNFGTKDNPMHADHIGEFDKTWANNVTFTVYQRVKDSVTKNVYVCEIPHTSPPSGTFQEYRDAHPDDWSRYIGEPIKWAAETPWSDFAKRGQEKHLIYINMDTAGTAQFDVSVFTNMIRNNPDTYLISPALTLAMKSTAFSADNVTEGQLIPARTMQFTAGDAGGWAVAEAPTSWMSGRRTREDRVWPFNVRGKLIRFRYSGLTKEPFTLISHTMYYFIGSVRR